MKIGYEIFERWLIFKDGLWHHVFITEDKLYIDGMEM